jgi:hypothetical protein
VYGEFVELNFPELELHQDAALVAQLRGAEAVADARALITAWVAANSADLRRCIHPASLRGKRPRIKPRYEQEGQHAPSAGSCGAL